MNGGANVSADRIASLLSNVLSGNAQAVEAIDQRGGGDAVTRTTSAVLDTPPQTKQQQHQQLQQHEVGEAQRTTSNTAVPQSRHHLRHPTNHFCKCESKRNGIWISCAGRGCKVKVCSASILGLSKQEAKDVFSTQKQKFFCRGCAGAVADDDGSGEVDHSGGRVTQAVAGGDGGDAALPIKLPSVSLFDTPFKCCGAQVDVGDPYCFRCAQCAEWLHAKCLKLTIGAAKLLRYHRTQFLCIDCTNAAVDTSTKRPRE